MKKSKIIEVICPICNTIFTKKEYDKQICCSNSCSSANKWQNKKYRYSKIKSQEINLPKQKLYDLYYHKKMTCKEIGKIFGVSVRCIINNMKRYNIDIKTSAFAIKEAMNKPEFKKKFRKIMKKANNRPEFIKKLQEYGKTCIGERNNAWKGGKDRLKCIDCGKTISTGSHARCRKCYGKSITGDKSHFWKNIPNRFCIMCNKKLTRRQILSNQIFCSRVCFFEHATKNKTFVGKGNHAWQGGKSFEMYPQEFNKQLKEEIRDRDERKCQVCGAPEIECITKLHIHHLDYNKKNNSEVNLISLCNRCHIKTNGNREYWEKYFTKLMISKIYFKKVDMG
jgi:hypothetical protein